MCAHRPSASRSRHLSCPGRLQGRLPWKTVSGQSTCPRALGSIQGTQGGLGSNICPCDEDSSPGRGACSSAKSLQSCPKSRPGAGVGFPWVGRGPGASAMAVSSQHPMQGHADWDPQRHLSTHCRWGQEPLTGRRNSLTGHIVPLLAAWPLSVLADPGGAQSSEPIAQSLIRGGGLGSPNTSTFWLACPPL